MRSKYVKFNLEDCTRLCTKCANRVEYVQIWMEILIRPKFEQKPGTRKKFISPSTLDENFGRDKFSSKFG